MKKYVYLFSTFLFLLIFSSCTQRVYLTVNEPPAVQVSNNYAKVCVINRSFSAGSYKVIETIDQRLSLEGNLDVEGSKAATQGAVDYLSSNPRFSQVSIIDSMSVEEGGINIFPAQLPWDEVMRICDETMSDFLVVLEVYDTDTKIAYSSNTVNKQTPLGTVPVINHKATMTTFINTGWRIYDPLHKLILDEFSVNDQLISSGSGINPVAAAAALLSRKQAVKQISTEVGRFYAGRLESQQFRVWRDYFNKGSRSLKMATRRSEVNDWDGAAELWQADLNNPKRKVAGRAYYNMAIYKEITGDLEGALEYAQKAYADYRIKEGLTYSNILRDRIRRRQQAAQLANQ